MGHPLRYRRKIKDQIIYDPRFPYIKINIDGFIQNTRFEKSPRGVLEIKSGLSYVWNEYKSGIPEFYIIQAQTYMLVTGLKYCEIAVLLDGRYFKCFPVWADEEIQQKIRHDAEEFWGLVQEGRDIWNDPDMTQAEKTQELSIIEPPIDGTPALDKYLKDRFRSDYKAGKMLITPEVTDYAMSYLEMGKEEKKWKAEKDSYGQMLRKIFLDNKIDEIIADDGKTVLISHRKPSENKNPVLRLRRDIEQFL
jgi:predicted phage-related endonuclease